MSVTIEAGIVELEVSVEAPPNQVFPYLIEPDRMLRWMGTEAELDPRPGGVFYVNVNGRDKARGEYVEVVPNERVSFTWGWEGNEAVGPGSSTVEISLQAQGEGTLVRLRHSGLPEPSQPTHAEGWTHYLQRLEIAGAGGDPGYDAQRDETPENM